MSHWLHVPGDWRRIDVQERYDLYWCEACRYGQLAPRPEANAVESSYRDADYYTHGDLAGSGRGSADAGEQAGKLQRILERIRDHVAWRADFGRDLTKERVPELIGTGPLACCDLGCGKGGFVGLLAELGHDALGVEPDPIARKSGTDRGLKVLAGTAESLPVEICPETFDVVFMTHVLEHCLDPLAALENARRILKPGGRLIVETPNSNAAGLKAAGVAWPWLDVPRHLNFFTARSLQLACRKAGLVHERTEYRGYCRQFQRSWLANKEQIRQAFAGRDHHGRFAARANVEARAWKLLLKTILATAERKYDSVRVVARK